MKTEIILSIQSNTEWELAKSTKYIFVGRIRKKAVYNKPERPYTYFTSFFPYICGVHNISIRHNEKASHTGALLIRFETLTSK